jgi:hypothetical protein
VEAQPESKNLLFSLKAPKDALGIKRKADPSASFRFAPKKIRFWQAFVQHDDI